MAKTLTASKHGLTAQLANFPKYILAALRGVALVTGGIGGLAIVGVWLLLLVFPIFIVVTFLLKFLGIF